MTDDVQTVELVWEHQTVADQNLNNLEEMLDEAGLEGWELVNVIFSPLNSKFIAVLRRKVVKP